MIWLLTFAALACPPMRPRRPPPPVFMLPSATEVVEAASTESTLLPMEPVLLPDRPDAVNAAGLRFGAWHWSPLTGEGRYAPLGELPRDVWHPVEVPATLSVRPGPFDPRLEDRVPTAQQETRLSASGGTLVVGPQTLRIEDEQGEQVEIELPPASGPIESVRLSPLGRYAAIRSLRYEISVDTVSGEVVSHRLPETPVFNAHVTVGAWGGELVDDEMQRELALGCDPPLVPRDHSLLERQRAYGVVQPQPMTAPGCAVTYLPLQLGLAKPAEIAVHGEVIATMPPLAPSCWTQADGELTIWSAGRERRYDTQTAELLGDEENHRTTWLTSASAALQQGRPVPMGRQRAQRSRMQRGMCGERAEGEGLRVWTFADGTWIAIGADGSVRGNQRAGHLGWIDGDRFVPVLPPAALTAEEEEMPSVASAFGVGSLWLGLGLLSSLPTRLPRRKG